MLRSQTFMICVSLAFLHDLFKLLFQFLKIHPFLPSADNPVLHLMFLHGWYSSAFHGLTVFKLYRQQPLVP